MGFAASLSLLRIGGPIVLHIKADQLPPEYRAEPRAALAGGDDGMDLVARIVAAAPDHLRPGGLLVLEIGHEARHFERRFPRLEFAYVPSAEGENRLVAVTAAALKAASGAAAAPSTR